MGRHFTNYVFSTYTYSRDIRLSESWESVSSDFNRYVQRIRRLHGSRVQYLRTVEAHEDSYPHIHAILRFKDVIAVDNVRYFDRALFRQWKSLWIRGLSDYQPPLQRTRSPLLYIIKYVTKGSPTLKTLWKKYYALNVQPSTESETTATQQSSAESVELGSEPTMTEELPEKMKKTVNLCRTHKIKQLSWSREFFDKIPDQRKTKQTLLTTTSK